MPHGTSAPIKQTLENLLYCVSIFQLISSLPTYPRTTVNLTNTYHFLFHSRFVVYCRTYVYCVIFLCKYLSTYLII